MPEKSIRNWLDEFVSDMVKKFEEHNEQHYDDFALDGTFDRLKGIDIDYLRTELSFHYAKWLYNGYYKKIYPESDTLTNLVNIAFLLWVQLKRDEMEI